MYPINYTHSKLWPLQWTETTWSFRKMGNATSVTLIILWMFLQNIRFCTISSALTKKNKSSYEKALKPFFLFYCLLSHSLSLSLFLILHFLRKYVIVHQLHFSNQSFCVMALLIELLAYPFCFLKPVALSHIDLFQFHTWNLSIKSVTFFAKVKYSVIWYTICKWELASM